MPPLLIRTRAASSPTPAQLGRPGGWLVAGSSDREPDPFIDTFTGLVAARAVTTAVMLGVFESLHERPASRRSSPRRWSSTSLGPRRC